jgi:photosystem II stability/assembly factor-like uncharacterized protein
MGQDIFAGTDSGIFVSDDRGGNWRLIPESTTSAGRVLCFATHAGAIFAATDRKGIIVSSDQGKTWRSGRGDLTARKVRSLMALQDGLYAGTDSEGVFRSGDGGQRWIPLQRGLPTNCQVLALAAVNGRIFAGLYSNGLYGWNEQAQTWIKAGPVTPLVLAAVGDTLVAGHNPGGIFWSDDQGTNWVRSDTLPELVLGPAEQSETLPTNAPVWEMASGGGQVFAGAAAGIYVSDDKGRTWTRALSGLPASSPAIALLVTPDFVLAGTTQGNRKTR